MSVGLSPTKADVDAQAGAITRSVHVQMDRVRAFKFWLDAQQDADLVALGYVSSEIATLRSAFGDLSALADVYQGVTALPVLRDFRAFARRLMGLGNL
jgi:hypothetical protein